MSGSSGKRRPAGVVLLDTSAVVAFLQPDHIFHASTSTVIAAYLRAGSRLAVSAVTLTELFTGVVLGHQEEQVVNGFLEEFGVLKLPLEEVIAKRAAQIRGAHVERTAKGAIRPTVRVPDAVILATADLHLQIETLLGADKRWNQAARGLSVRFVYLGGTTEAVAAPGGKRSGIGRRATEGVPAPSGTRSGMGRRPTSLYRGLPHGPHGMGRDEVMRHQRARLFGAMIEAVHRQGYQATTVEQVIALAGVSRRAFWEQFASKEDCFLGTYDIAVARAKRRMLDGWMRERGWANRVAMACQEFFADSARNSKSTRLVLVDGLGLGSRGLERMWRSSVAFERVLRDGFASAPDGVMLPPLGPKAIVGGTRYVMLDRLLSKREAEIPSLSDEVLDWISAYRSPAASIGVSRTLPPHRPAEPARFLESEGERARLLGAMMYLLLDVGYGELTDKQIAQFGGVSTRAFHKQFSGKQECLLALVDAFVDETLDAMTAASADAQNWPETAYLGVKAAVTHLVIHPGLTRISLIDVFETGPAVGDYIGRSLRKLANALAEGAPEPCRAPRIAHEAVAGALWAVVLSYVARRRLHYLPPLGDHLAFIVLAPYLGPKAAAQEIGRMSGGTAS